jgi:hypothetical protein
LAFLVSFFDIVVFVAVDRRGVSGAAVQVRVNLHRSP